MSDVRTVKIESEFVVHAPAEKVFAAFCHEQHEWYPHTYGGERVRAIVLEPRVGGQVFEDWGDGAGHLYGTVSHYDPPASLSIRSRLADGILLEHHTKFVADGDSTLIKDRMVAFGEITDEMAQGIQHHGDLAKYEDRLRSWVEKGAPLGD
ncbi:MAG TPA: hypothetical protein VMY88_10220 [Acidimicrobiales bacterium]|nr:hypothetical protein [Acidimicrobiales bacterium]